LQTADHAEQAARRIAQPDQRARALANIATVRAQAKDHTRARRLAAEAEQLADTVADHFFREPVLAAVAAALARVGQHSEAEALARSLTIPDTRATALAEVAIASFGIGVSARLGIADLTAERRYHQASNIPNSPDLHVHHSPDPLRP